MLEEQKLSTVDRELLALLLKDSRQSISSLSVQLSVSRTTVKNRIERLKDSGVISRFTIEVNATRNIQHYGISAFFNIQLHRPVCKIIYAYVSGWPELRGCWSIAGGTDMILHVSCVSHDELERLRDSLARHREVKTLWTQTVLRQWAHNSDVDLTYDPNRAEIPDMLDRRLAELDKQVESGEYHTSA